MELHVIYSYESMAWQIKQSGQTNAISIYPTKQEAIQAARQLSIEQHCELVIHNKNGQIARKDSHQNDSAQSKG